MDGMAEGTARLAMLLLLVTALPALGVSAALGSMAVSARDLSAPKGLPRRAGVGMLVVSLVVPVLTLPLLWSDIAGFADERGASSFYSTGATPPFLALALAAYCRLRPGEGTGSRAALVLAVLSCSLYAAPALLYGYTIL